MRTFLRTPFHHLAKATIGALIIASSLLSANQVAAALEAVTVQLKWKHQFQFAGLYAALEQGFYREEGLDVRLIEGSPDHSPMAMLLTGRAEYAVADSGVLLERAKGKPVVVLAVIFQHSPSVLMTRSDIRKLADLNDKRIMLRQPPLSAEYRAMLDLAGVRYIEQASSFNVEDLISGRTDAYNAYSTNEPFLMQERGIPFEIFRPSDYGIDIYGDTLISTEAEVKKHPDRAAAFRRATIKGWEYALNNASEIVELIRRKYNTQQKSLESLMFEAEVTRNLMPNIVPVGFSNIERWRHVEDIFIRQGLMSGPVDWDRFLYKPRVRLLDLLKLYPREIGIGIIVMLLLFSAIFSRQIQLRQKLKVVETLQRSEDRLKDQQAVLLELNKSQFSVAADLPTLLVPITEAAARTLDVERVSVWLYNDERNSIVCHDLYQKGDDRHNQGAVLQAVDYPGYFQALAEERVIVADDAHTDPATREFSEAYLAPLGISSMLDTPVRREGQTIGVVCHEHTGPARQWTLEEQTFAASIADMVALYLEEEALRKLTGELEQRVRARTAELEVANQAKSEFLSRMSHELRTPLNAILGFAQVLDADMEEPLQPGQRKSMEQILNSGWHLLEVVNDLLDLAAIEANKVELRMEVVNLVERLQDSLAVMQPLASKREITLSSKVEVCNGIFVLADPVRLKQVLLNLFSNAVKYNRQGGSVTLSCEQTDTDAVRISVTDTGPGIPEEDIPALFEPFSRLYLHTYATEGTGIGLAIAKQLVEQMGGHIGVTSTLGQGSTFWIELSLSRSPAQAVPTAVTPPGKTAAVDATMLYIEDSPSHVQLVETIVDSIPGLQLLSAHTPQLGLELAQAHRPDIILLDICLPEMDGFAIMKQLRASEVTNEIPVIAVSANALTRDIEKGLRAGFRRYLTKPINVVEFKKAVDELLRDSATLSKSDS